MSVKLECGDFLLFQETLKQMRDVDDKIIYALNTSIPTDSFKGQISSTGQCQELYDKLKSSHNVRQECIKKCIRATAERVKDLKMERETNQDDIQTNKQFKSEQRKLRLVQSELNVEDIIKERTYKIFNERCRLFFQGDAL